MNVMKILTCFFSSHQPLLRLFRSLPAMLVSLLLVASLVQGQQPILEKGHPLPSATVTGTDGKPVTLDSLKGRVTLISVVPQLNTPVCDEQTHRFSEQNGGLDQFMHFVTMSTNTSQDQAQFADKANIHNITFLSDAPHYHFGTQTGLLLEKFGILHRAVILLDAQSIVRYVEMVPMSQLPDFDQAYRVARSLLGQPSSGVAP
jgi:thiol peroxidase